MSAGGSTRPPQSGASSPASRPSGSPGDESPGHSGGPWSQRPSRRSGRVHSRRPEPEGLTGRQWRGLGGAVLAGALLVYAAWNSLSDDARSTASSAAHRASTSTRFPVRRGSEGANEMEEPSAPMPADAGPVPKQHARLSERERAPALTWLSGADPSEIDAGAPRTPHEEPSAPAPSTLPAAASPPGHPALDAFPLGPLPPAAPAPAAPDVALAGDHSEEATGDDPMRRQPLQRHFVQVFTTRWQQPGLCAVASEASAARNTLMLHFRRLYWDNAASLFLDPRLSNSIQRGLIEQLEAAEAAVRTQLQLEPWRPNVFAYADEQLLLAASCANPDVVAYYDGAIHVVPSHADVAQSVLHEYTHHALMSTGLIGPAWAQEGIAMTVANETWWRQRVWLDRVAEKPFSLDSMEQAVPYTLTSEQATLFYVQAAAMVTCALQNEQGGLVALVSSLRQARGGALDYTLPALADPRYFRACANKLSQ
jgi:hypothetical protein